MPRTPSKNSPKKTVKRELAAKRTNTARGKKNAEVREVRILLNSPELGSSGLEAQSGFIREAYTSTLQWPTVYPIYNKMRRATPEIVMIRNAFTTWCRSLSLQITLPEKPTDDDKKYQEFLYSVFDDMEGGLDRFLDTLVNHVPFMGWGWWEVVPGRRNPNWKPPVAKTELASKKDEITYEDEWRSEYDDDLIGIRRLAWRSAGTFSEWEIDDRTKRLHGMWQEDYPNPRVLLPLKDSLHITFGDPNNPEGLSPLEAVYRLERIHYGLSVIMGIGYEHAAGYLNVTKTEQGTLSADDKALVKNAAMAIMTAQEGNYALWPFGLNGEIKDIGFAAGGSLISAMQHYSTLMLSIYNMQWMALNTMTGTGSFAAANDSSSMSVMSYNAMMEGFAEQLDQQIGRRLYEWNKTAFPNSTKRPKISFTKIDKQVALNDISSFVASMQNILPLGEDDLLSIRKRTGFLAEVLPTKQELLKQAEEKAEITAASQPKQEEQQPSWDWFTDASNGNESEFSIKPNGASAEMAMNTLARRYYELHYGGVDGKQPHPDGSPQSVHGSRRARRGQVANPRAMSRQERMSIIQKKFKDMIAKNARRRVTVDALEREITMNRGINIIEFREALNGLVGETNPVLRRSTRGMLVPTSRFYEVYPQIKQIGTPVPASATATPATVTPATVSAPTPAPIDISSVREEDLPKMSQEDIQKMKQLEIEAADVAKTVTKKIQQEIKAKIAFGSQFNVEGGFSRKYIEKNILSRDTISKWEEFGFKQAYNDTDPATFVSFYNYIHPESGLQSVVTYAEFEASNLVIGGNIYNKDRRSVGEFKRNIMNDGHIHNSYFRLDDAYHSNNFGKAFYENVEEQLVTAGAKKITIYANIDIGLYAWARMGFTTQNQSTFDYKASAAKTKWRQSFNEAVRNGYAGGFIEFPKVTKMYELAVLKAPWDGKYRFSYSKSKKFGQDFLLGTSGWDAVKYLDLNNEGFIVGQLYYEVSKQ